MSCKMGEKIGKKDAEAKFRLGSPEIKDTGGRNNLTISISMGVEVQG